MTSLFTFGVLVSLNTKRPEDAIQVASMLAIVVGCCRFLMGLLKIGRFIRLLKEPVIVGFTSAAAILIIASQVNHLVGIEIDDKHVFKRALGAIIAPQS